MAWGLTVPLFPVFMVESGLPIRTYGLVQSYAALAAVVAQLCVGRLSDRLGRRKPLLIASLFAVAPVVVGFPYAASALAFGLLMSLHSMAQSTYRAMNGAWVTPLAYPESLGRVHGVFRIAGSLGWIVATPLLGLLRTHLGDYSPFFVAAAIYTAVGMCVGLFIGEVAVRRAQEGEGQSAPAAVADGLSLSASVAVPAAGELRATLRALLPFFAALAFFHAAQGIGMNFNTIYLKEGLGLSDAAFGWMVSAQAWLEVPFMIALGSLSDRLPARRVLGFTFAVSGLRWLLLSVITAGPWLLPVQLLNAAGVTAGEVLALAFVARQVPKHLLATALGWKLAVQNGAMLLAPAIGGYLAHLGGLRVTFRAAAALALVAGAVMLVGTRSGRGHVRETRVG